MSQSAISPLDVLADELGAAAGRIERELRHGFETAIARLDARVASIELAALRAENERELRFVARLAELKDGRDGRDGIDGKDGIPGRDGVDGIAGERGIDGAHGRDGVDGRDGERGTDGLPGRDGRDGTDGSHGERGEKGDRGEAGQPGKLPLVKNWTARVHYEGDVVTHDGSTYQAVRDTGGAPPSEDWQPLAIKGADARGFRVRGTWNASKVYEQNDVVALGGSSFVAVKDEPGTCPGEGWQLLASAGKPGGRGQAGESVKGEKGERGEKGASIIAGEINPDIMVLDLVDSDGEKVTLDLEPLAQAIASK